VAHALCARYSWVAYPFGFGSVGPSSLLAFSHPALSIIPKGPSAADLRLDSSDTNCSTANLRDASRASRGRDFRACNGASRSSPPPVAACGRFPRSQRCIQFPRISARVVLPTMTHRIRPCSSGRTPTLASVFLFRPVPIRKSVTVKPILPRWLSAPNVPL
jgi:hypothetical protein